MLILSLRGMNIGGGDLPSTSGELAIVKSLPSGSTVFDVGANRGQYARMALGARPDLTLHCFEPSLTAFGDLQRVPGIKAHNFGLSDEEGNFPLYSDSGGSTLSSIYPRKVPGISFQKSEQALFRRLDHFCAEAGLTSIELLKLDVEGHEVAVLRGMGDLRPARVQFEFGGSNIDSRTYLRDLFHMLDDYVIHRILPNGLRALTYNELMEQFTTTNYLAVRR
jgi:FkbM family methyltransferase